MKQYVVVACTCSIKFFCLVKRDKKQYIILLEQASHNVDMVKFAK